METVDNPELQLAFDFIHFTNRNVFLTGKAGTGKTTFLHTLKKASPKRMIVVAPTGVAAINAGGVTIHSFFQLPFHPHIPVLYAGSGSVPESGESSGHKMGRDKINIIKGLDLLIIDEISMVRSDLLDAVDSILRRYKNRHLPFGGVQLLMIGDIQQLAPVVKEDDWEILEQYYRSAFFFGSLALQQTDYVTIELQHVYRQKDLAFITLLNKIRDNQLDSGALLEINKRYDPNFNPDSSGGYITLTTHNSQAQVLNDTRLEKLPGRVRTFKARIKDDFPEFAYPTAFELYIKTGAQVMFVKNDMSGEKLYFNGKIGKIVDFYQDSIMVQCTGEDEPVQVGIVEWQNMKYTLNENTKEIEEKVIGTFAQYPLKLAWAITIHKSQGLTFDKAIIDARAAFAHGQVYVALSRCRTLEGIVLSTPVSQRGIITDPNVSGFARQSLLNKPDQEVLSRSKKTYQQALLTELFDFGTMQRQTAYCLKLAREHQASILGNIAEPLAWIEASIRTELTGISEKFKRQLQHFLDLTDDAETNTLLQERISKACQFFAGIIEGSVGEKLDGITLQTDNKEIRKSITEALDKLRSESALKLACLKACISGFVIKKYLEVKAKALIEAPQTKSKKAKPVEDTSGLVEHPGMFSRIRSWRDAKAVETGLPHYMILPQKTMALLSGFLPQSMASLKQIKGMGKIKSEQFGDELLEMIRAYCMEKNITPPPLPATKEEKPVKAKKDTRLITYNLYKAGKKVSEIARERNMAVSTIEEHLSFYVGKGDLSIDEFVSPDITALIASHFEGKGDRLAPVKAALGDQVSWSEVKFVFKHLQFSGKLKST
jgi:hypothetical protein